MDPVFYAAAAILTASLFFLVYSIRRYVELKNSDEFDEVPDEETPADLSEEPEIPSSQPVVEQPVPSPDAVPDGNLGSNNRAEAFVKGIYEGLSGLDTRLKNIEASVSKGRVNNDFAVKFLEDILSDLDSLDKEKIKARIDYLLSDLKK